MKKLKKVYVEITNVCNLSCAFCPGTFREPGFMSGSEFETVLRRIKGYTQYIYFHVMGEPLLHPDLEQLLKACLSYGYKANITTNGSLIADKAGILLESRALRQVNFSLHCMEQWTDELLLDKYLSDIFKFTDSALAKGGVYISLRLWNLTSPLAEKYNGLIAQRLERRYNTAFSVIESLKREKRIKLCDRLFLNSAEVFKWPSATGDEIGARGFCLGLRDQAAILVDGTVVPCCLDSDGKIPLGNIFEDDFHHILYGERAKMLYDGFSEGRAVEALCRRCSYRNRFSSKRR